MKKILSLIIFTIVFAIAPIVSAEKKDDEDYLWTSKGGGVSKVYHYGTGEAITLPSKYFTFAQEMRGVWVATVYNIAINKQKDTSVQAISEYKNEFLSILDRMEEFGMNTIFFQIRPSNDAFYKSSLNPWSEFLVGKGIDPGWDPLSWMIEETHKRGFDFQCWMNAYRVTTSSVLPDSSRKASSYTIDELVEFKERALDSLAPNNFARLHPEYVVMGEDDTRLILNPSEVAVQDFIVETLKEIIENYDIDGMHFDDYFYLNGSVSSDVRNTNFAGGEYYDASLSGKRILNDLCNYNDYLQNDSKYAHMEKGYSLGDFRRESINVMMRKIRKMVDEYNETHHKAVEFGSKPAAVWRSNIEYCTETKERCVENGSNTHAGAYSSYNDLFADTKKWVEEGLVDYVAPQVYYAFEDNIAGYADIVDWWVQVVDEVNAKRVQENKKEIKLYIAHGIYKYRDAPSQFYNSGEIRNQVVYNKKYETIKGSAFYSYENLYTFVSEAHEKGIGYVKTIWQRNPVYPIAKGENDADNLRVDDYTISKDLLDGKIVLSFLKPELSRVYGLYKVEKNKDATILDVADRIKVIYDPYVPQEQAQIRIDDYDPNYDYYLEIVSKNGYIAPTKTKLDFSSLKEYTSISIYNCSLIPQEVECSEKVNISFDVENLSGNKLKYKVWYFEKGIDRNRLIEEGDVSGKRVEFTYKAYTYPTTSSHLRIEVTDGEVSTYIDTNTFNTVRQKTYPYIASVNLASEYYLVQNGEIIFNIISNTTNAYNVKIDLIDESNKTVNLLDQDFDMSKELKLTNEIFKAEGTYYFSVTITQGEYELKYNTLAFRVIDDDYLSKVTFQVDEKYNIAEDITFSVTFGKNLTDLDYIIYLIDASQNIIDEVASGKINGSSINISYHTQGLPNKYRLRLTLFNEITEATALSNEFEIVKQVVTPVNNKTGCKCKKSIDNLIFLTISLACLCLLRRKKQN